MQQLLQAFNTGDLHAAMGPILFLVIAQFSVTITQNVINLLVGGLKSVHDYINTSKIMQNDLLRAIDDKFFQKLEEAVEAMMPLAEDLKVAAGDGKLTPLDIQTLQQKAWAAFLDNLGAKDLLDFAMHLLPIAATKGAPRSFLEDKLQTRFTAMLPRAIASAKLKKTRNINW